jgi:hypothetical protein
MPIRRDFRAVNGGAEAPRPGAALVCGFLLLSIP